MAKKDYYVNKDSMSKSEVFLKRGTKVSLDDKEDAKLIALGNVEIYNPEIHTVKDEKSKVEKENTALNEKVGALEKENTALNEKVGALEKENTSLKKELEAFKKEK